MFLFYIFELTINLSRICHRKPVRSCLVMFSLEFLFCQAMSVDGLMETTRLDKATLTLTPLTSKNPLKPSGSKTLFQLLANKAVYHYRLRLHCRFFRIWLRHPFHSIVVVLRSAFSLIRDDIHLRGFSSNSNNLQCYAVMPINAFQVGK